MRIQTISRSFAFPLAVLLALGLGACSLVVESELKSKDGLDGSLPDGDVCPSNLEDECQTADECPSPEMSCEAHVCGDMRCFCPVGFTRVSDHCEWTGFIADPGFEQGTPPWSTEGDAAIDTSGNGQQDPGLARFDTFALCGENRVVQSVTMPAFTDLSPEIQARGLVVEMTYRGTASDFNTPSSPVIGFESGDIVLPVATASWQTQRSCLGAGAYDTPHSLSIGGTLPFSCGGGVTYSLDVDRVEFVPAEEGECPPHESIANGNFESDEGWSFSCNASNNQAVSCDYGEGGASGSGSAHLTTTRGCSMSRVDALASFPLVETMPNAAVEFWANGTLSDPLRVYVDATVPQCPTTVNQIGQVNAGTISSQLFRFCIPPEKAGFVGQLSIGVGTGCACLVDKITDIHIDNVQFVSDVGCAP